MRHIFRCGSCSKYTMKESCSCGSKTLVAKPIKYSPDDSVSQYRRKAKTGFYKERGLI